MAATTTAINGSDYVLMISTDAGVSYDEIGDLTSASLSSQMATRDVSAKQSAGHKRIAEGQQSSTASGEVLVTFDTEADIAKLSDLWSLKNNRTKHKVKMSNGNSGDYEWIFDAYITGLNVESGVEDTVTASIDWEVDGELNATVIA